MVRRRCAALAAVMLLAACRKEKPDAYGNFEATEVVVSAEVGGQLLRFEPDEGERLAVGAFAAQVDTATQSLAREEMVAQRSVSAARVTGAEAEVRVLRTQLQTAREEHQRTLRLFRAQAATAQELNRLEGEVRSLRQRIAAAQAQAGAVGEEVGGVDVRVAQAEDRIRRSRVVNPITGTVLTTYAEAGEFVQPGQPLYKIANLDTLTLRAYVSGAQLHAVRIGERVRVRVDRNEKELDELPGWVSWIASRAEFTPTPIQTRDERTEQVYAIQVRVPNPRGRLKIGMPGEVVLTPPEPAARAAR
jgi:HlyD family secretion protein